MRCCLFLALYLVFAQAALGLRMVSREAPEAFELIEPLLTPIEDVLQGRDIFPDSKTGGVTLLHESVRFVAEDGKIYSVIRAAYHTRRTSGIASNERDTISVDKERQNVYLIEAFTLDELGQRQDLAENAAFLHSPQKESSQSLYTSREQLVLVYPGVREGVTTAFTVLIEEHTPIMPGHMAGAVVFGGSWPTYKKRLVLDLPLSWEQRLNVVKRDIAAPDFVRQDLADERVRYEWATSSYDGRDSEHRSPESLFIFPSVWYTTVQSWDEVAHWYNGLISDRNQLGERLAAACEEATAGLTERHEIIQALTTMASDKVRYTGLEFGLAGYQPYDCNAVWENGYGDCKDKSNLLVALLRHKGIEAHTALLNTNLHGMVEQRAPSWRQFTHAIVAIPEPDGSYLLVDPTVEQLRVGDAPQSDSARQLLLITDKGAVWIQSRDSSPRGYHASFEINVGADGKMTGWLDLHESGLNAARVASALNKRDRDGRRRYMHDIIDDVFPGAQTLDVEYAEIRSPVEEMNVKAYFEISSGAGAGEVVRFPFPASWLPHVAVEDTRTLPYETFMQRSESTAIYTLEGRTPASLPEPFSASNELVKIEASWRLDDSGRLVAHLSLQPLRQVLSADEYLAFRRAIYALRAWLARPVVLTKQGAETSLLAASAAPDIDFPLLATGAGQLRLLDERYPSGRDDTRRRQALQQILQWFPEDAETQAEARTKLILLDWETHEESQRAAAENFQAVLNEYGARVDLHTRAWIAFLQARADYNGNHNLQAIERLIEQLRDISLSSYRRGWAGYYAASFLHDSGDSQRALEIASEAIVLGSETSTSLNELRVDIHLLNQDALQIQALIQELLDHGHDNGSMAALLEHIVANMDLLENEAQLALVEAVRQLQATGSFAGEADSVATRLVDVGRRRGLKASLQEKLRAHLDELQPDFWIHDHDARTMPLDELIALSGRELGTHGSTISFHFLLRPDTSYDQFAQALYHSCWQIKSFDPELRDPLVKLIDPYLESLPPDDGIDFVRAIIELAKIDGREQRTIDLLDSYLVNQDIKSWPRVTVARDKMRLHLLLGDEDGALATARVVEDFLSSNKFGTDIACMQLLIHAQRAEAELARQALDRLNALSREWLDDARFAFSRLLYADDSERDALQTYWAHSTSWWQQWVNLCEKYDVEPESPSDLLITASSGWLKAIDDALAKHDPKQALEAIRPVILGIRAHPRFVIDLQHAIVRMGAASNSAFEDARGLYMHITANWAHNDEYIARAVGVSRAGFLHDLGRYGESLAAAVHVYNATGSGHEFGDYALRVWLQSAAALKQARRPIEIMEDVLQAGVEIHERHLAINALKNVYIGEGKTSELRSLYERERAYLIREKQLAIVDQFQDALYGDSPFQEVVRDWIQAYCSEWFEAAWPQSLEGLERNDKGAPLLESMSSPYSIKVNMLVALDPDVGDIIRQSAFASAAFYFIYNGIHPEERTALLIELLDNDRLDSYVRYELWMWALRYAVHREDAATLRRLLDHPAATFEAATQEAARRGADLKLLEAVGMDAAGLSTAAVSRVAGGDLDYFSVSLIASVIQQLVYSNRQNEALIVQGAGVTIKKAEEFPGGPAAIQLSWKQAFNNARIQRDYHEAVLALLQERYGPLLTDEPASFAWNESYFDWSWQTSGELFDVFAYAVQSGRMRGVSSYKLTARLHDRGVDDSSQLHLDLLNLAISTPAQPTVLSDRIDHAIRGIDVDTEAHRVIALAEIESLLSRAETPQAVKDVLKQRLAAIDRRHPSPLADRVLVGSVGQPVILDGAHIQRLLATEEPEALEALLDSAFGFDLGDYEGFIALAIAYDRIGRKQEAALAWKSARASIETLIRDDSLAGKSFLWSGLPEALWLLEAPELLPAGLERLASMKLRNSWNAWNWSCGLALLKNDWAALLENSNAVLQAEPEFYRFYGLRAVAHAHLGATQDALRDLETYRRWNRGGLLYFPIIEYCERLLADAPQVASTSGD